MARTIEELMNGKLDNFSDRERNQLKELSETTEEVIELLHEILDKLEERDIKPKKRWFNK